jgi:hypothetical protein
LPQVEIDDDELLRAKRKADRAGLEVPRPREPQRGLSGDSIYPGREFLAMIFPFELSLSFLCDHS